MLRLTTMRCTRCQRGSSRFFRVSVFDKTDEAMGSWDRLDIGFTVVETCSSVSRNQLEV
jgi:hypothetical protein